MATSRNRNIIPKGKIKRGEITALTRQLATLLTAGIPLLQAFSIIAKGQQNLKMQALTHKIKYSIEKGNSVAETLAYYPQYFGTLYQSLILAGERSGTLDRMFEKIALYRENMDVIRGKIKKALFYPTAVIMIALLITVFLLVFIVPQFKILFTGFGAQLPTATLFIIKTSEFLQTYGWILLLLVIGFIIALNQTIKRSSVFANKFDRLLLALPITGSIIKHAILARFARTLATTFAAGLPLIDAIQITAGTADNRIYNNAILKIADEIKGGNMLHSSLKQVELFPYLLVQMIAVGEESGTLEKMLQKSAEIYEKAVDNAVENLSSLLEPVIMVILGLLIGGLVIAMYLPIFKLGSLA